MKSGAGLAAMWRRHWRSVHPAGVALFAVVGAVITAIMATSATFMFGDFNADLRRAISTALIGVLIVASATVGLILLRRPAARTAILIGCALILSFSLRERILPEARALNVSSQAVAALTRARLSPRDDRPLWVVGYTEPSLIFLTRTDIRMSTSRQAGAFAAPGDAVVIENATLATMGPSGTIDKGFIELRNGRIAEVGPRASVATCAVDWRADSKGPDLLFRLV